MEFLKVEYLYLMLIPSFLFFYLIITKESGIKGIFSREILAKLKFDNNTLGLEGRNIFLFLALFFIIIALARPVGDKKEITIKPKSYNLVTAIDISKSMKAKDFYPNRFLFAKEKFKKLLEYFPEASVGVIAFSDNGFLVSPITSDFDSLRYLVDNLSMDFLSKTGTDFIPPIEVANHFLEGFKEKILLIFTDGGDNNDFSKEITLAKRYNLHIYIYALGDKKGTTIIEKGEILKDKKNNIIITKLNRNIQELAIKTDGAYVEGGTSDKGLKLLIDDIKMKFEKIKGEKQKIISYKEYFYIPLLLAFLFLMIAFTSLPKKFPKLFLFLLLFLFSPKVEAFLLDFKDINEAKRAYNTQNYREAIEKYKRVVKSKKSAESYYNLANAYYKNREYDKAILNYSYIISNDKELLHKKFYNIANSYMQKGEYKRAIKFYQEAIKIERDRDALSNIELAKKLLKEKREKKIKNQQQKKKRDKKKNQKSRKREKKKMRVSQKNSQNNINNNQMTTINLNDKIELKENISLSDQEEKKWNRKLQNQKPKTKPILIERGGRKNNENFW